MTFTIFVKYLLTYRFFLKALVDIKDISRFPKLDKSMVKEMDRVLSDDIAKLLEQCTVKSTPEQSQADSSTIGASSGSDDKSTPGEVPSGIVGDSSSTEGIGDGDPSIDVASVSSQPPLGGGHDVSSGTGDSFGSPNYQQHPQYAQSQQPLHQMPSSSPLQQMQAAMQQQIGQQMQQQMRAMLQQQMQQHQKHLHLAGQLQGGYPQNEREGDAHQQQQ